MGPIAHGLCQSKALGLVMWLAFQCSFPPPVPETAVSLETAGVVMSTTFQAPVDTGYDLILTFTFPSTAARLKDSFVGDYGPTCADAARDGASADNLANYSGQPLPLAVTVTRLSNSKVVVDKTVTTVCSFAHGEKTKIRSVAGFVLERGEYKIDVSNVSAQPALRGITTSLGLVGK